MSQALRNKLTGLLPADQQPPIQDQIAKLQTIQSHVIVPLVNNLLGGLGAFVLCAVLWLAVAAALGARVDYDDLRFWCGLVGAGAFGAMSIVRFLGDDLGFITAAYRAGVASADAQISGLVADNQQLQAALRELRGTGPANGKVEKIERARAHAEELLGIAHAGGSIAREKVATWCPQRSWEAAVQLLKASGALTANNELADRNLALSLNRLREYAADQKVLSAAGAKWVGKWELEAKH